MIRSEMESTTSMLCSTRMTVTWLEISLMRRVTRTISSPTSPDAGSSSRSSSGLCRQPDADVEDPFLSVGQIPGREIPLVEEPDPCEGPAGSSPPDRPSSESVFRNR